MSVRIRKPSDHPPGQQQVVAPQVRSGFGGLLKTVHGVFLQGNAVTPGGWCRLGVVWALLGVIVFAPHVMAQVSPTPAVPKVDSGDTSWVLASSALVLAMIVPGLALFYGGLVRSKNVLGTITHSFIILCLVSLLWVLAGYSLTFGPDQNGLIGGLDWVGLSGVGFDPHSTYGPTIPHQAFMVFQLMFAAITPALMTGAFAERMRFTALLLFAVLWSIVIYCPLAHWIWGGGWLGKLGALDFAGGAVVHISSGFSALVCAVVLGRRHGYGSDYMAPHNLPLTLLGTGMLWFGWFGFNAGSALGANAVAVSAFVVTNTAAAVGALTWMVVEWLHRGNPTALGLASGAVAGLATITPAAGYVGPASAIVIGFAAGAVCYLAIVWKGRIGYDDSLDVFGIHGVGGLVGILATGLFASKAINPAGADGLFFGNPAQFSIQALTAGSVALFSLLGTFVLLKVVDSLVGVRVSPEEEMTGLDLSQHSERAYSFGMTGTVAAAPSPQRIQAAAAPSPSIQTAKPPRPRSPVSSSRRPPVQGGYERPHTASEMPLAFQEEPFGLVIQAGDQYAVKAIWGKLCHDYPTRTPREFNALYPYVVTFSEDTIRFHKGDPDRFREELERLFALCGLEQVRVEVTH